MFQQSTNEGVSALVCLGDGRITKICPSKNPEWMNAEKWSEKKVTSRALGDVWGFPENSFFENSVFSKFHYFPLHLLGVYFPHKNKTIIILWTDFHLNSRFSSRSGSMLFLLQYEIWVFPIAIFLLWYIYCSKYIVLCLS